MLINDEIYDNLSCKNYFNPNRNIYIELRNLGNLFIKFILQYNYNGRTFTVKSSIFSFNQSERIMFPQGAQNPCFNVLNHSRSEIPLIYHGCISSMQPTCFNVYGNKDLNNCVQVQC